MGNVFYFDWEVDLIEWIQQNMGKVGEYASRIFSFIGGETVTLLLIIIMLFCYKKEVGKRVSITVLTASMWFPMIKNIVLRVRPYMAHPDKIKCLQVVESDADPMDIVQQGYSCPVDVDAGHRDASADRIQPLRGRCALSDGRAGRLGCRPACDRVQCTAEQEGSERMGALCDSAGIDGARYFLVQQPGLLYRVGPSDCRSDCFPR